MTRNLAFLAVLLAGCLILLSLAATYAHTGSAWRALPSGEFRSLVPAVPGWSGDHEARPAPSASRTPTPTPSGPIFSPTAKPVSTSRPCCASSTISVKGIATWFCRPPISGCTAGYQSSGMFAAAGPGLRIGNWRGRLVTVTIAGRHVQVRLIDWCQCGGVHLIDLFSSVLDRLALPLGLGTYPAVVTW